LSLESERLPPTLWHGYALGWKSNPRRCSDRDSIPWNSVPGTVGIVQALNLANNYLALIIPLHCDQFAADNSGATAFSSNYQKMEDSAKVDGYNTWQMLLQILLP